MIASCRNNGKILNPTIATIFSLEILSKHWSRFFLEMMSGDRYGNLFLIMGLFLSAGGCGLAIDQRSPQPIFQAAEETSLTDSPDEDFYPAWSPDGRRLAFVSTRSGNWDIWVMNRDGSEQQSVTVFKGLDAAPAWNPDGKMIAFASRMFNPQNVAQLVLADAAGGEPRLASGNPSVKQLLSAWSPNKHELAVIVEPMDEPAHWELRLVDVPTAESKILVKDHVDFAALSWHPDGESITFVRRPREKQEIWAVTREGTKLRPFLADQWNNLDPNWSPDGRILAFTSDRSGYSEVWLLDTTTQQLQQLSFHQATARYPRWSPDGMAVAFSSNRSGSDDIWILSGWKHSLLSPKLDQ